MQDTVAEVPVVSMQYARKMYMPVFAVLLTLIAASPVRATGFNVNPVLDFVPLTATYRTQSSTVGCPAGFVGTFSFTAQLTNKSNQHAVAIQVPGLEVRVKTLSNGNVLLDPQTNEVLGGPGAVMQVPRVGQYGDGILEPGAVVDIPFVLCLKSRQSFQFLVDVLGIVTQLVNVSLVGTASSGPAAWPVISADGRFVAFLSSAHDLVAIPTGNENAIPSLVLDPDPKDVFVRDLQTGTTTLVSVNHAGTHGGNRTTDESAILVSANGRFVAFTSEASDLVANDTNFSSSCPSRCGRDVFVRDIQAGTTMLASVNHSGTDSGNSGDAYLAALSPNGRFVAFLSSASDLVANDTNGQPDVFVRDLQTGTTTLVSANRFGTNSGNDRVSGAGLSANGRYVAFFSTATDLVANDNNGAQDVFVRDLQTGTTSLVSLNRFGTQGGNNGSALSSISADGRFVAFTSEASDLVANDNNGAGDLFVRDLQTGLTSLVSVNRFGTNGGNAFSDSGVFSADNRILMFSSLASDLVANDTNLVRDVFARDLVAGTTTLVTVNRAGTNSGNKETREFKISADGCYVAFLSLATDLTENDSNNRFDLFVRDRQAGITTLISADPLGTAVGVVPELPMGITTVGPSISADGHIVAFSGIASNLAPIHTNATAVFVRPVP